MIVELILLAELLEKNGISVPATQQQVLVPVVKAVVPRTVVESIQLLAYPEGWDSGNIVVNLGAETLAIYEESERVKKALRGL